MHKHATEHKTGKSDQTDPTGNKGQGKAGAPSEPGKPVTAEGKAQELQVTPTELEALLAKAAEAEKFRDQFLRSRAEFDNYRKRIAQEKKYWDLEANERIFQRLLTLLDNFELAIASAEQVEAAKPIADGIKLLYGQFQTALRESGVEEIDALHKKFDPNFHEAIQQVESAEHEEGTVVQQTRKGYKFKDRLLRPASVIVSRKPAATPTEAENEDQPG